VDNISEHITYQEAIHNNHGFFNIPDAATLVKMKLVASKVFEPVRNFLNEPITVNSFFRCALLNKTVGGVSNSQHRTGEAIDMDCGNRNKEIFDYIRENLDFDQLINEFPNGHNPSWVHCSYSEDNRKQILVSIKEDGKTKYIPFIA